MYKNDIISEFFGEKSQLLEKLNESYKMMDCGSREMQKPCANQKGYVNKKN
jgi:hypothetical protein